MQALNWNFCLPLRFGNSNTPLLELRRAVTQDPSRERFEAFIQERFRKAHKAQISQFMPELFGLQDSEGSLQAVAGIRLAISEPLFLERYLDEPMEHTLESTSARAVDRLGIVEVGNLAAANLGSARLSIITVTWLLAMAGLEWVAFTGNSALVNSFNRLGLRPVTLCPADPLRLGEERHAWGNYYETRPPRTCRRYSLRFPALAPIRRIRILRPPALSGAFLPCRLNFSLSATATAAVDAKAQADCAAGRCTDHLRAT